MVNHKGVNPGPPQHRFMDPCGQEEGTDHCWLCGRPLADHPRGRATPVDGTHPEPKSGAQADRGPSPGG